MGKKTTGKSTQNGAANWFFSKPPTMKNFTMNKGHRDCSYDINYYLFTNQDNIYIYISQMLHGAGIFTYMTE